MCRCVFLCCAVYRFTSASVPKPVNGSSASAPSDASTSATGCAPAWMRLSKNRRPQMARGRERARLEHAHKPISPIGSAGSLPSRSTVPQEESPGSNALKTRSANVPNGPVDSGSNRGIQWWDGSGLIHSKSFIIILLQDIQYRRECGALRAAFRNPQPPKGPAGGRAGRGHTRR